jgi:hypothetical protein
VVENGGWGFSRPQQQQQRSSIWDDSPREQQLYHRLAQRPASAAGAADGSQQMNSSLRSKSLPRQRCQRTSVAADSSCRAAAAGGGVGSSSWRGVLGVGCSAWSSRDHRATGVGAPSRRPATACASLGTGGQNPNGYGSSHVGPRAAALAAQLAGLDALRPAAAGSVHKTRSSSKGSWLHSSPMKRLVSRGGGVENGSSSRAVGVSGASAAAAAASPYRRCLTPNPGAPRQPALRLSTEGGGSNNMVTCSGSRLGGLLLGTSFPSGRAGEAGQHSTQVTVAGGGRRGLTAAATSGPSGPSEAALAAAAASLGLQSRYSGLSSRGSSRTAAARVGLKGGIGDSVGSSAGGAYRGSRQLGMGQAVLGGGGAATGVPSGADSPLTKQILAYAARRYSSPQVRSLGHYTALYTRLD